jgi:hypothetical protein
VTDLSFKARKRNTKPVTFDLGEAPDGDTREYSFQAPKTAALVLPMLDAEDDMGAAKSAMEWLDQGLSQEDLAHIVARLKDPEDDLDFEVIEDLIAGIVEKVSGRPTT